MTSAPTLTGQDIGQAERATRAVLDRLLHRTGTSFYQWVVLNRLADGTPDEAQVAADMVHGLKITSDTATTAVREVLDAGLAARRADGSLALTAAGDARFRAIRDGIAEISRRLYSGIPEDDLAAAKRVLTTVTTRANDELSGSARGA
ncbi:MAG: MarR family winged helix-turn-helix transcriptional regulator [Hyphomicrobiales bacterium]